jgi:N-acetylglutamate synthase-like GNAT family acetyltransferase
MYRIWIEKSVHGYADAVLVGRLDGAVAGYVTYNQGEKEGEIVLVASDTKMVGQHVGGSLVATACNQMYEQGIKTITVATQGRNCHAQAVYQKCGFTTKMTELYFHKWMDHV